MPCRVGVQAADDLEPEEEELGITDQKKGHGYVQEIHVYEQQQLLLLHRKMMQVLVSVRWCLWE